MKIIEVPESEAFSAGDDLWVIKNDFNNKWWNQIDFRSGFLLSHCLFHHKKQMPHQLAQIIEATDLGLTSTPTPRSALVLGSQAHFLNKWILIWQDSIEQTAFQIEQMIEPLHISSVRFFSDSPALTQIISTSQKQKSTSSEYSAGPKASLYQISFIENT